MRSACLIGCLLCASTLSAQTPPPISVISPDGKPVKVDVPGAVLVPCTLPTDGIFPLGVTEVPCPGTSYTVTVIQNRLPDWTRDTVPLGVFRTPSSTLNPNPYAGNGLGLAFNEKSDGLLFSCGPATKPPIRTAELTMPATFGTGTLTSLPRATLKQACQDPTEGRYEQVVAETNTSARTGGYLIWKGKLFGSLFAYYDGNSAQSIAHYSRSANLSEAGTTQGIFGLLSVPPISDGLKDGYKTSRFDNVWIALIPEQWQQALGGPVCLGGMPFNISGGASNGPSCFAFDPDKFAPSQPITPLLYYTVYKPLNPWNAQSNLWNGTAKPGGAVFVDDAFWVFYTIGTGPYCYGDGYTTLPVPEGKCYDPLNTNHGGHAWPYETFAMGFRDRDLADVKAGLLKPYELRPYGVWPVKLPFTKSLPSLNGVTYNPATRMLVIEQAGTDSGAPLFHPFHVNAVTP